MFNLGARRWPGISKLIEECGEVLQVCGKLMGNHGKILHWDGTNLRTRLEEEIGDVLGATDFVIEFCDLDRARIQRRAAVKRSRFVKWRREQMAGAS